MKRVRVAVVLIMVCFIIGCAGITIDPGSETALIKISAIKLGGEFAKKYPGEIEVVTEYAEKMLDESNISAVLFEVAKNYLVEKVSDDPVDQAVLEELLSMVVISDTGTIDSAKLNAAIEGFLVGVRAYQSSSISSTLYSGS